MPNYNSILNIKDILNDYSIDVQEGIEEAAKEVSKKGANKLKTTKNVYTVRTGKYNKGWRVKTEKGRGYINCTIHNSTDWQLTHLLENGHITRNGSKTRSFVHIAPVEKECINEYEKEVEKVIKNGG